MGVVRGGNWEKHEGELDLLGAKERQPLSFFALRKASVLYTQKAGCGGPGAEGDSLLGKDA